MKQVYLSSVNDELLFDSLEDCFEDKLKYLQHTLGFAKLECIKALRQTNEDIVEAVKLLNIMQKSKSIDKY